MSPTPRRPRLPHWPELLAAFLAERQGLPFAWGVNDCVTFTADAVRAVTGLDPLGPLRGQWSDAAGAGRAIVAAGGLLVALDVAFGPPLPETAARMAPRGSPVCVDVDGRLTVGIAAGNGFWCAPGVLGLEHRPMHEVRLAWAL